MTANQSKMTQVDRDISRWNRLYAVGAAVRYHGRETKTSGAAYGRDCQVFIQGKPMKVRRACVNLADETEPALLSDCRPVSV